jgi:hypothetical protein
MRSQRIVFTAYLVVILGGLLYFAALGVSHR